MMEVIAAIVVAVVAILGLAYSFGTGRALIDRYARSRAALAAGEGQMEMLSVLAASDTALSIGASHTRDFVVDGQVVGIQEWNVVWVDDPIDGTGGGDPSPNDLKRVTLQVSFHQGSSGDVVELTRFFPAQ
jgi:hypothetical protein